MKYLLRVMLVIALIAPSVRAVKAQGCQGGRQFRLDQENYVAINERLSAYTGDIQSLGSSGGWKAFSVQVLVSQYRRPFLLSKGSMRESDVNKLMSARSDIMRTIVNVTEYDPKRTPRKPTFAPVTIKGTNPPLTVRVSQVQPVSNGTDSVILEVCGL